MKYLDKTLLSLLVAVATSPLCAQAADDDGFEGFREAMTVAEFQSAGLYKLTPREMDRLEAWVRAEVARRQLEAPGRSGAAPGRDGGRPGRDREGERPSSEAFEGAAEQEPGGFGLENEGQQSISSRIDGEFRGWDGDTIFKLENGQVWKQTNPGSVYYRANRPKVTITREFFGFRMEVEGLNKRVQVKRIK